MIHQHDLPQAISNHSDVQPAASWGKRHVDSFIVLMLFLLALGCFANTLDADLLPSWDDNGYVIENPLIRDLSPKGLWQMWSQLHFLNYIPVTLMSYAIDYQLWGLNPFGYHLTNVLLHAVNGSLVYLLCCQLRAGRAAALLAAVLFVVHPVQVESVAWVSERKNLLSLFFFILAFLAHIRCLPTAEPRSSRWLEWGLYALALCAKPIVVAGALLFMSYDYLWGGYGISRAFRRNLLPLSLGLISVGLTILAHREIQDVEAYWGNSPWLTAWLMLRICWEYAASLVAPLHLNNRYIYTVAMLKGDVRAVWGCGLLALMVFCAWRQPLGKPLSLFAILWVWILMLPVANIVPFSIQRADRYLYFPSVMVFLLVGLFVSWVWQRLRVALDRYALVGATGIFILTLLVLTLQRNEVWSNGGTLWRAHLTDYPSSLTGVMNLGVYHYKQKEYGLARRALSQVVAYQPRRLKAQTYLAQTAFAQGRHEEAIARYWHALKLMPQEKQLYCDLGTTYYQMQRYRAAIGAYESALGLDPTFTRARFHLGQAALRLQDYALAREALEAVLRQDPDHAAAADGLCEALAALGERSVLVSQCPR